MDFKILNILLAILIAFVGVNAGNYQYQEISCENKMLEEVNYDSEGCILVNNNGYMYKHCNKELIEKGMKFGETFYCEQLPNLKSYSMPYETQPEKRETYVHKIENFEQKQSITVLDNSVKFGESICNNCEEKVVLNDYSEPYQTQPISSENILIKFIKSCFFIS